MLPGAAPSPLAHCRPDFGELPPPRRRSTVATGVRGTHDSCMADAAVHRRHRRRRRPGPAALGGRPAAPHRTAPPGQARGGRRGPPRHVRRVRRGGEPDGERARRPRAGQGRPAGAAVAQLLAVRGAGVRHRPARRRAGAGQLHARRRRDRLHPAATPARSGWSPRTRWPATAEKALASAGLAGGLRGWIGDAPGRRLGGRRRLVDGRAGARPRGRGRRRRSAAADVHLGHRVAAQGRDALSAGR